MIIICSFIIFVIYYDDIRNYIKDLPYPSNAFYDFEDDGVGSFPSGFRGQAFNGSQVIQCEENESFGKVAEIKNNDENRVELYTRYKRARKAVLEFDYYGTVEAYSIIDISQINENYDPVDDIRIKLDNHKITVKCANGSWIEIGNFTIGIWYHFKIKFDMSCWEVWINDGTNPIIYAKVYYEQIPSYFCHLYWTIINNNRIYVDNVKIRVLKTLY